MIRSECGKKHLNWRLFCCWNKNNSNIIWFFFFFCNSQMWRMILNHRTSFSEKNAWFWYWIDARRRILIFSGIICHKSLECHLLKLREIGNTIWFPILPYTGRNYCKIERVSAIKQFCNFSIPFHGRYDQHLFRARRSFLLWLFLAVQSKLP